MASISLNQDLNIKVADTLKTEKDSVQSSSNDYLKQEVEIKTESELLLTDGIIEFANNEDDWENINEPTYLSMKNESSSAISKGTNSSQLFNSCNQDSKINEKETPYVCCPFQDDPPPIPDEKLATVMKFLDRKSKSHPTGKSAREAMIAFHKTGMPASEIAKFFSVNAATVRRWIKRYKTQNSVSDLPRSGRQRIRALETDKEKG